MPGGKLRLGPVPNRQATKVTVSLTEPLHSELERYARAHHEAFGQPVELSVLIPHMLDAFMARDRVFQRLRRRKATS